MATVGELKINVTACGMKELDHLLVVLAANIDVLPVIVVKALQPLKASLEIEADTVNLDATNV